MLEKFAREDLGRAGEPDDVAGGSVQRLKQIFARAVAPVLGIEIGAEQPPLDKAGGGEGGVAQAERVAARGGG